jgi:hypothetical protein
MLGNQPADAGKLGHLFIGRRDWGIKARIANKAELLNWTSPEESDCSGTRASAGSDLIYRLALSDKSGRRLVG